VNCCCGHSAEVHAGGGFGSCQMSDCDCVQWCDCHLVVAEIRRELEEDAKCT
jgi:hypothetical protein